MRLSPASGCPAWAKASLSKFGGAEIAFQSRYRFKHFVVLSLLVALKSVPTVALLYWPLIVNMINFNHNHNCSSLSQCFLDCLILIRYT